MSTSPTRFSQAQILIAALFAVVMTGKIPAETDVLIKPQRKSEFSRGGRYEGIFSEVAAQCGRRTSYVSQVARGIYKNQRVARALQLAMEKRDLQSPIPALQLTDEQVEQLRNNRHYWGIATQVSRDLKIGQGLVSRVISGLYRSERITKALIAAMAKRDAEHAAKQVSK